MIYLIQFLVNALVAVIAGVSASYALYNYNSDPEIVPYEFELAAKEARNNLCTLEKFQYDLKHKSAPVHHRLVIEAVLISKDKGPKECGLLD